jgi:hypothetical protein
MAAEKMTTETPVEVRMAAVTRTTVPTPVSLPDTGRRRGRATPRRRSCQRLLGQPRLEATSVIRDACK